MLVSAWLPYSDTLTPAKTVAEMRTAGITTAVLMVNDFSTARAATGFKTFDPAKIRDMAHECNDAEINVWLCSWIMPHEQFIAGAIDQLPPLLNECQADMLMWDAEEPWTDAHGQFNYATAAARIAGAFPASSLAVTAIGSAPIEVTPLATVCSVWVPQAYATMTTIANGQATPAGVVPYSLRWWRERYGEPSTHWIIGLAGYDQAADPATTMQPPIDDAIASGMNDVAYWTNNSIAAEPAVASFVAGLSRSTPPHPGIMPLVDIAAMPSGTRVQVVAEIQGLLMAWGVDPGPLDGKPGAKTLAGVKAFQQRKTLAQTGVVDASTWSELLRP
jgi:hypothetical protein